MPRLEKIRVKSKLCSVFDQPFVSRGLNLYCTVCVLCRYWFAADVQIESLSRRMSAKFCKCPAPALRLLSPKLFLILARAKRGNEPEKLLVRCKLACTCQLQIFTKILCRGCDHSFIRSVSIFFNL